MLSAGPVDRRAWLRHCSVLALAAGSGGVVAQTAAATPPPRDAPRTILVVGDSLSAEYGLARGSGWVALLERRLAEEKIGARVVNASVSGETTSGGRSRLPALLVQHKPSHVILELGGNDALRGLPLAGTEANLQAMAGAARAARARVLIAGMRVPPNYGRRYADDFFAIFPKVAKAEGAALLPFLLAGVADGPDAAKRFQADGIHPLAAAHPTILANVWPVLRPLLLG